MPGKWSETGESFHTEDANEWIESDIHPVRDETHDRTVSKKSALSKTKSRHLEGYTISNGVKGEHNFALRVKGDSMEPEFNDGDIIIVSPTVHPVAADSHIVIYIRQEIISRLSSLCSPLH